MMIKGYMVTVWKSDFKDFPGLYEAVTHYRARIVQKATNFVVVRDCNPYDETDEKCNVYNDILDVAREEFGSDFDKIKSMLDSLEYNADDVIRKLNAKLCYPPHHVMRRF